MFWLNDLVILVTESVVGADQNSINWNMWLYLHNAQRQGKQSQRNRHFSNGISTGKQIIWRVHDLEKKKINK